MSQYKKIKEEKEFMLDGVKSPKMRQDITENYVYCLRVAIENNYQQITYSENPTFEYYSTIAN